MYFPGGTPSGGRGRGFRSRGTGRGMPFFSAPQAPSTPAPPLGTILASYKISDLDVSAAADGTPKEARLCKYVGSYNWLNTNAPVIIIPGLPPTWTPPQSNPQLQEDAGEYFRDINAAKYPSQPMQAAITSVLDAKQMDDFGDIDVFACGSTFGNLLRFVRRENKPFRMLVEVVGNTVLLIRRENSPRDAIQGIRGYGHTMPEAYTTWRKDVKGSETHQRIIRYDVAGLECLVRFETDGYLPDKCPDLPEAAAENSQSSNDTPDDLAKAFGDSAIQSKDTDATPLEIKAGGCAAPQSALFDLKTRSIKRQYEDFVAEQLARLWISMVPNFVLAFHDRGRFVDIRVRDVQSRVNSWEAANKTALDKFGALLKKIVLFARDEPDKRFELEFDGQGELHVREPGGDIGKPLPNEVSERWVSRTKH